MGGLDLTPTSHATIPVLKDVSEEMSGPWDSETPCVVTHVVKIAPQSSKWDAMRWRIWDAPPWSRRPPATRLLRLLHPVPSSLTLQDASSGSDGHDDLFPNPSFEVLDL